MMRILVAECPLKHLLQLFAAAEPIRVRELGDTMHPSSGYVDQTIVAGVTTVGELQAHAYDFCGLVYFAAEVAGILIQYRPEEQYELSGPSKAIWRLSRHLEALNAEPDFWPKLQLLARREA